MSIPLSDWLSLMHHRFPVGAQDFDMYMFDGTLAEIEPVAMAWHRPDGVVLRRLDIAELCEDVDNAAGAKQRIEEELSKLGAEPGHAILLIDGLHLLPGLYPSGPLQPIIARLRSGGRVLVFIAPPAPGKALPEVARLDDWRELIRTQLGGALSDHLIVGGGSQS